MTEQKEMGEVIPIWRKVEEQSNHDKVYLKVHVLLWLHREEGLLRGSRVVSQGAGPRPRGCEI